MTNPILDFYIMCWAAGKLRHPVFKILEMPSQDGKSLTSYRFANRDDVVLLPGDTTAQAFRNELKRLHSRGISEKITMVLVEDASKIRRKVKEDFFALCGQFGTGLIAVDQNGMDVNFRTFASVIINCPPFYTKTLIDLLLGAGTGNRFDKISTALSNSARMKLDKLGSLNQPNPIRPIVLPQLQNIDYKVYEEEMSAKGYSSNKIKCMYACKCAGIDENLVDQLHNKTVHNIQWTDFWIDQVYPNEKIKVNII